MCFTKLTYQIIFAEISKDLVVDLINHLVEGLDGEQLNLEKSCLHGDVLAFERICDQETNMKE